ncbi:uncharacterized protein LOC100186766 [Ciona intestinalis]
MTYRFQPKKPVFKVHRKANGLCKNLIICLSGSHFLGRTKCQIIGLVVIFSALLLGITTLIDIIILDGMMNFAVKRHPHVCEKAHFFTEQFNAQQKMVSDEIQLQNLLLSSSHSVTDHARQKIHPITQQILESGSHICPLISGTLVGPLKVNEDLTTLGEDLKILETEFKARTSVHSHSAHRVKKSLEEKDEKLITVNTIEELQKAQVNYTNVYFPLSNVEPPVGVVTPGNCYPHRRTAIVIPYRNRSEHLKVFLRHLHPILLRQDIEYGIYVINQVGNGKFNRAKLLNVGFSEALKHYNKYDCVIFHDVDLLPEDDRNIYTCSSQPKHMSIAVNIFDYKLPYNDIFGGVTALTPAQFQLVNGYSNEYWGWGGEDDDMYKRIKFNCMSILRISEEHARYLMVRHHKDKGNEIMPERFTLLKASLNRQPYDGLKSLNYTVHNRMFGVLYNNISVSIGEPLVETMTQEEQAVHFGIGIVGIFIIYILLFKRTCS